MAGLTRKAISTVFPASAAAVSSCLSSSSESTETRTSFSTARAMSVGLFEFPLKRSDSGRIPATRASVSSPAEKTSAPAPIDASIRSIARLPFAFAA